MPSSRRIAPFVALVALVFGAGCHHTERVEMTREYVDVVMAGVAKRISAAARLQFGPMEATRLKRNGAVRVCGTVSAPDEPGASAVVRFVADLYDDNGATAPIFQTAFIGSAALGSEGIDMMCAQADL